MAISKFNYNSFNVTPVAGSALSFNSDADGFSTAVAGSMTLIKTVTASSSSNVTFVHGTSSVVFDNTYSLYLFKFINLHPATNQAEFEMNLTADGSNYNITKTTTFFTAYNYEAGASAGLGYTTSRDLAQGTGDARMSSEIENGNDSGLSGEMYIFNPSSTTFVKHFFSKVSGTNDPGSGAWSHVDYMSGYGNTTSAITGARFDYSSGNIDSGTIKLYGIKDS
tara:strand:- start:662 stop:1330 length:669 start_codon:yes stop_codon:yes gene_type:complete